VEQKVQRIPLRNVFLFKYYLSSCSLFLLSLQRPGKVNIKPKRSHPKISDTNSTILPFTPYVGDNQSLGLSRRGYSSAHWDTWIWELNVTTQKRHFQSWGLRLTNPYVRCVELRKGCEEAYGKNINASEMVPT